ncbi:hypothetical protein [Flaviaesturariibacter aridisoli]|uniref:DUF4369 domain-containing protein n=1 Tax=Flaviaesturariibacter aridisoli TaxID=2545761 RepID=A0A4R4EAV6_9BACT|nr:hypothetical protein [Flaviaesturariibacter aridisoli]TCZ75028.1 hypothetical protein E0486_01610 [Flaviaesturariibacter aridisoli]
MKRILTSLLLLWGAAAAAQQPTYVIEAGQSLNDALGVTDFYRYASFRDARVQFRDGYVKPARMNLNYVLGRLEFITPKGDTLMLEGEGDLAHVAIGTDTFFFYGGAQLQVGSWKGVGRLLQHQYLQEEGTTRVGAYESNDPSASAEAVTRYNAFNQVRSVAVRQRTTFVRESKLYFWKDNTAEPVALDRRSLEKAFPDRKPEIAEYLRQHKVNFRLPADVNGLIRQLLNL